MSSGPFQVICKYSSDENIDNKDFDSIEVEIKDKYFGDQVTFYTIRPGHDNMENKNLVIAEFSAPIWIDKDRIIEIVKETVSNYIAVLEGFGPYQNETKDIAYTMGDPAKAFIFP